MKTTRRNFLKLSAIACSATLFANPFTEKLFADSEFDITEIDEIAKNANALRGENIGNCVINIAKKFLKRPYLGQTLDNYSGDEKLVYTLEGFDCVTICETSLALARCIYGTGRANVQNFARELTNIRYRDGIIDKFPSRLHYTSDWIYNNSSMGIIKDISKSLGGTPIKSKVGFMSSHPNYYRPLKDNPSYVEQIK